MTCEQLHFNLLIILPDFYYKCLLFHLGIVAAGVDDCDDGGAVVVVVAAAFCAVIAGEKSRSCTGKTFQTYPVTNAREIVAVVYSQLEQTIP